MNGFLLKKIIFSSKIFGFVHNFSHHCKMNLFFLIRSITALVVEISIHRYIIVYYYTILYMMLGIGQISL